MLPIFDQFLPSSILRGILHYQVLGVHLFKQAHLFGTIRHTKKIVLCVLVPDIAYSMAKVHASKVVSTHGFHYSALL